MAPNTRHDGFPVRHFVRNYTHNLKTKRRIRTFYLYIERLLYPRRHLFSWLDLYAKYDRRVMNSNTEGNHLSFRYNILCVVTLENYRSFTDVLNIEWLLYTQRCLFSVLELDARYEWRGTTPNTHRSLFPISHFCVHSVLNLKTSGHMWTFNKSNDSYVIGDIPCVV